MKFFTGIALLTVFYSCLQVEVMDNKHFPAHIDSLTGLYGEPLLKESSPDETEYFHYPGGLSFEIDNNQVISKHVAPQGMERSLPYWKEKFEQYESNFREISGDVRRDGIPFKQEIKCPQLGIKVVYDPSLDEVVKVIYTHRRL
jgi:hypothetical protein